MLVALVLNAGTPTCKFVLVTRIPQQPTPTIGGNGGKTTTIALIIQRLTTLSQLESIDAVGMRLPFKSNIHEIWWAITGMYEISKSDGGRELYLSE